MSKLIVNEIEKYDAGQLTITTGTNVSIGSALSVTGNLAVDTNTLYVDAANNRVGVGTSSVDSGFILETAGNIKSGGNLALGRSGGNYDGIGYNVGFTGTSSNWNYIISDTASLLSFTGGGFIFSGAASGTSGNAITFEERMRIDSSGNVGIGDLPSFTLDVNITSSRARFKANSGDASIELSSIAGRDFRVDSTSDGAFRIYDEDAASERMRIDSSGNVGIGSSLSSGLPDKVIIRTGGTSVIKDALMLTTGDGDNYAGTGVRINMSGVSEANSDIRHAYIEAATSSGSNDHYLSFGTNAAGFDATERMRIDSSGNVGIGTQTINNPFSGTSAFQVGSASGTTESLISIINQNNSTIYFGDGSTGQSQYEGYISYKHSGDYMIFATTDAERMRITSGGFLKASNNGVYGSSTALYHEVRSNRNDSYIARLDNTATSNGGFAGINIRYTGISPDANSNEFLLCEDSTAIRMRVYSDGDVWTSDAGTLTSDETLKTNITDATSKLDDVMNLRVRNYYWKEDYHPEKIDKKLIGFVAQEFEQVFPHLVSEHKIKDEELAEDGTVIQEAVYKKGIKEGKLIPILVKAMQEQQEIINDLKARIETLEAK